METHNGLWFRAEGATDAPTIVFSNSLGTTHRMWDAQAAALRDGFRVVRYDTRGHGESAQPAGPLGIGDLGRDLISILDRLEISSAHACGCSMGGMTVLWAAANHPARITTAVLANTGAKIGNAEGWNARIAAVESGGLSAVRDAVLARFLSPGFRVRNPKETKRISDMLLATKPGGYIAACEAIRDADLRPDAVRVRAPALIITGALDEATPPLLAEELRASIPGSELSVIPNVAHLSNVEAPTLFTDLIGSFIQRHSPA